METNLYFPHNNKLMITLAQIHSFVSFPTFLLSFSFFSMRMLGLEVTWLQINTLEEFVLLLKSVRLASESPPLFPPTRLYNTSVMESDLHCIPVLCRALATADHLTCYGVSTTSDSLT